MKLGIPTNPDGKYRNCGWRTWYHFCGTQPRVSIASGNILLYIDCAIEVQGLGISSKYKWHEWCVANSDQRKKLGIPSDPPKAYKDTGWSIWPVFLGTLRECVQCREADIKCVYSINETQCQRCKVLKQVCTIQGVWDENYTACWNYKQEKGSMKRLATNNIHLYNWLRSQFSKFKHGLSAVKKEKLYRLHKGNESSKMLRDFIEWYNNN